MDSLPNNFPTQAVMSHRHDVDWRHACVPHLNVRNVIHYWFFFQIKWNFKLIWTAERTAQLRKTDPLWDLLPTCHPRRSNCDYKLHNSYNSEMVKWTTVLRMIVPTDMISVILVEMWRFSGWQVYMTSVQIQELIIRVLYYVLRCVSWMPLVTGTFCELRGWEVAN